jgi:hypothetical protein
MHLHSIMESYFHNVDHVHAKGMNFATCLFSWFCTIRHALWRFSLSSKIKCGVRKFNHSINFNYNNVPVEG